MQVVGWELSPNVQQLFGSWRYRNAPQGKVAFLETARSLFEIALRASSNDIRPACSPTTGAGHYMVEGQLARFSTVLAAEFIAQKQVEARKGRRLRRPNVVAENDNRRNPQFRRRRPHHLIVF